MGLVWGPPQDPHSRAATGQGVTQMWATVPSYLCHLRGQTPPGPLWGQTPRAAAAARGLGPCSALQGGSKNHQLCLESIKTSKISQPCIRGTAEEIPQPMCVGMG